MHSFKKRLCQVFQSHKKNFVQLKVSFSITLDINDLKESSVQLLSWLRQNILKLQALRKITQEMCLSYKIPAQIFWPSRHKIL
jgi:hypothetical protein